MLLCIVEVIPSETGLLGDPEETKENSGGCVSVALWFN